LIPAQVIAAWRTTHPWINDRQVEQDLILTRLAVEIAGHPELRDRLVWRGGTCLHKIVMPEPLRYIDEVESLLALERRALRVDTGWWRGETDVLTFHPAEMIGTKFRALAQRSKGRDLNDLELARLRLGLDDEQLAACAAHYLHHEGISSNEFKARLFAHLGDPNFVDDVARFITDPSHTFEPDRLVERWIWWSDEFLDPAMVLLRTAGIDGIDAEGLIRQSDLLSDGLV
jgi:hypothetical protein